MTIEQTMKEFQDIIRSIRKLKSEMRMKNSDAVRVDAIVPEDVWIWLRLTWPSFESDVKHMGKISEFHCEPFADDLPETEHTLFAGKMDLANSGHITAWTTEESLALMLDRFPKAA